MTTEKDESFFHSVVTKTVDGFVVSSSSSSGFRGGKIIFPSNPSFLPKNMVNLIVEISRMFSSMMKVVEFRYKLRNSLL